MSVETMSVSQSRVVNGINVAALEDFVEAIKAEPNRARFQFRVRNRWIQGSENRSEIQGLYGNGGEDRSRSKPFFVTADEPAVLFGTDRAPNPGEYLLHALAACITTTLVQEGASEGIRILAIESAVEGDIDLRGTLRLDESLPKGLGVIRVKLKVRADATREKLTELAMRSPMYNTLRGGVPIEIAIEHS